MDPNRARRINGLSRPYTPAQLSTWVLLPVLVLEFCLFNTPLLPLVPSIVCTVLFCLFALSSTYFAYTAMSIDPKDPRVPPFGANDDGCRDVEGEETKQCWLCDVQVGIKSMHCKFCNKCIDHFDHHCLWLNTCVGKANYKYFFRTMLSITGLLAVHTTVQIFIMVDIFVGRFDTDKRAEDWLNADAKIAIVVVIGIFLLIDLAALSLILQLLSFHIKLQREGLSTYTYIVRDGQRRREKMKKDNELAAKRDMEIQKAQEMGASMYAMKLQCGGVCYSTLGLSCCDPLAVSERKNSSSDTHQEESKEPE